MHVSGRVDEALPGGEGEGEGGGGGEARTQRAFVLTKVAVLLLPHPPRNSL